MLQTIMNSLSRKPHTARRSMRLEVESLEGRDMPSALAGSVAAVWPPPPPAQVSVVALGGRVDPGGASGVLCGSETIDLSAATHVASIDVVHIGEEIPQ